MPSFEYDSRYLQAALDQLESYLLGKDIYRTVGASLPLGTPPYPQLTLGNLLLAKERAQITAQTSTQLEEITRLQSELQTTRSRWRSAWGKKATHEFRSRLNLWADFLNEYRHNPEAHHGRYAYEVSRRVLLELLLPESLDLPEADTQLVNLLDSLLREISIQGKFIWEQNLKPGFPADPYWYLYRLLPRSPANTPD